MEIVILSGGLGNQMFEYAFYLAKCDTNQNVYLCDYSIRREGTHNGFELERLFHITLNKKIWYYEQIVRIVRKLLIFEERYTIFVHLSLSFFKLFGIKVVKEKYWGSFQKKYLLKQPDLTLFFGFWQSEKYFHHIKEKILELYNFRIEASEKTLELLSQIQNENSISIHIRRGDYFLGKHIGIYGNICTVDYYANAINLMKEKNSNFTFFIFSDDINWVKENMDIPNPVYIDWNRRDDSWQDMYLMSQCKHNIIANSTFSWWGAWLNQNENKIVISPSIFLNTQTTPDLIPDNWIKI